MDDPVNHNKRPNRKVVSPSRSLKADAAPAPKVGPGRSSKWDNSYAQLVEYVKINGHAIVPNTCNENPRLGHWVRNQRSVCRKNEMSERRMRRLEDVGFCFDARVYSNKNRDRGDGKDDAAATVPPAGGATAAADADASEEESALRFDAERILKRTSAAGRHHYYCRVMGCMKEPQGGCDHMCRRHYTTVTSQKGGAAPEAKKGKRCKVKGCYKYHQTATEGMCWSHFILVAKAAHICRAATVLLKG